MPFSLHMVEILFFDGALRKIQALVSNNGRPNQVMGLGQGSESRKRGGAGVSRILVGLKDFPCQRAGVALLSLGD